MDVKEYPKRKAAGMMAVKSVDGIPILQEYSFDPMTGEKKVKVIDIDVRSFLDQRAQVAQHLNAIDEFLSDIKALDISPDYFPARARDEDGQFVADDPNTPENEAYE